MIIVRPNETARLPISVAVPTSVTCVTLVRDICDPIYVIPSAVSEYMVDIAIPSGTTAGLYDWSYGANRGVLEVENGEGLVEYDDGVIYDEQYLINGDLINDLVTNTSQTWSSQKIRNEIDELAADVAADHYTKYQTDTMLNGKADKSTTYTKVQVDGYLSGKANSSDVYPKTQTYTKSEVNTLLAGKADSADTYTKAEVNSLLSLKADASNVYSKTQIDNKITVINTAIASKADAGSVYTKQQTYTKGEVDSLVAAIATFEAVVVSALPQTGDAKKMYFVPKSGVTAATNVYEEYLWVRDVVGQGSHWELIGETGVDMSQYYTKSEVYTKAEANTLLAAKQATLVSGTNIKTIGGQSLLGSGNIQAVTIGGDDYEEIEEED